MTYKRTKRRYLFAVLSLLFAGMLALSTRGWLYSYRNVSGAASVVRISKSDVLIASTRGQVEIDIISPRIGWLGETAHVAQPSHEWPLWSFCLRRGKVAGPPVSWVYMVGVPYWFLTSLFAILLILSLHMLTRYRPIANACPKCAYDLSGSAGRSECPECGEAIAPDTEPAPPVHQNARL